MSRPPAIPIALPSSGSIVLQPAATNQPYNPAASSFYEDEPLLK